MLTFDCFSLSISNLRSASLKSPKVLFTRTGVKDNFFTVPSFNISSNLTSELSSIDCDSDTEADGEAISDLQTVLFGIGQCECNANGGAHHKYHANVSKQSEHNLKNALACRQCLPADTETNNASPLSLDILASHNVNLRPKDKLTQSDVTIHRCRDTAGNSSNGERAHRNGATHSITPNLPVGDKPHKQQSSDVQKLNKEHSMQTVHIQRLNGESHPPLIDGFVDIDSPQSASDHKAVTRKSRKHQTQEQSPSSNGTPAVQATSTPTNKKVGQRSHCCERKWLFTLHSPRFYVF